MFRASVYTDMPTAYDAVGDLQCRNSLVHTGRFYGARADEENRATVPLHSGPTDE